MVKMGLKPLLQWSNRKLIIVSNRLPLIVTKRKGKLHYQHSTGGLVAGLEPIRKKISNIVWIGWPGIHSNKLSERERKEVTEHLNSLGFNPVFLTAEDVDLYYYGFCNRTLWPLFHYFLQYVEYDEAFWRGYVKVNNKFEQAILSIYKPGDVLWIHDYHLMLLPDMVRRKIPDATIGFFLHIPFPSYEMFRTLPWRKQILKGMLGADLIGFHIYDYMRHFLSSVRRILGLDYMLGKLNVEGRIVKVDAFPLGIDYGEFIRGLKERNVRREYEKLKRQIGSRKVIFSIDRLDYTKGIPERLRAFETFLRKHPEFRDKVVLVLAVSPSRTKLKQYLELKRKLDELVGSINGEFGSFERMPIHYIYRYIPPAKLYAMYRIADVALITPLRDGMNLVAKEFIAAKENSKGVLILSELAGSASELVEAIIVNPYDKESVANAIYEALTISEKEQARRLKIMQEHVRRRNALMWANSFIKELVRVKEEQKKMTKKLLTEEKKAEIVNSFMRSKSRLLFLDYDGTLVPFAPTPEKAMPDEELINLLKELTKVSNVVIMSGRSRKYLERWFGNLKLGLAAEHGVLIKMRDRNEWEPIETMKPRWKEEIRSVLEYFVDRTPGSFVEEKEYSLVWHYRQADPELGFLRAAELKETLLNLAESYNLSVLEGKGIVEVRPTAVNKGAAARLWLMNNSWNFIMGVGDDWTDECLFEVLPQDAYSIKVGMEPTKAKYVVKSYKEIRSLLKELVKSTEET